MDKPEATLKKEFEYYLKNQEEFVKKYNGRFLVIIDSQVIGDYESELEAINETLKTHEAGTFLVQKCEPGSESYSQTFHSRVSLHDSAPSASAYKSLRIYFPKISNRSCFAYQGWNISGV